MMRKTILAAVAAACATLSVPAHAEASANAFLQHISEGGTNGATFSVALNGYENGYGWSNAMLENSGRAMLYCQPATVALTPEQLVEILRRYVTQNSRIGEEPAGLALLLALMAAFPC